MKKIKLLLAMIIAITLVSVCAMANNEYIRFVDNEIECSGEAITINLFATTGYTTKNTTLEIEFDSSKWDISGLPAQGVVNGNIIGFIYDTGYTTEGNENVISFTATPKTGADINGSTFRLYNVLVVNADESDMYVYEEGTLDTLTVKKAAATPLPEPTEKLPTTFTANGETYNAVNTTVTVADYAGATSGNVIATYWKNGVTELLTKSIPFSTATGTANITGTAGSASFAVAITNVPETVVITAINIAF